MTEKYSTYLKKHNRLIFFVLTVLMGIYILYPLRNFQYYLSQGDHGRDLYCFKKVMDGWLPYRDFSWLFGPLMPYYYIIFYKLFGVSIQSILLGQNILILSTGIIIFLTSNILLNPAISFTTAIWYWAFRDAEFFYTYNHSGGLLTFMIVLYFCLKYIRKQKISYFYYATISATLFMLIRLNMGIAASVGIFISFSLTDFFNIPSNETFLNKIIKTFKKNIKLYTIILTLCILFSGLVYFLMLHGLESYEIRQCFPFLKSQRTDSDISFNHTIEIAKSATLSIFFPNLARKTFSITIIIFFIASIFNFFKKNSIDKDLKSKYLLCFVILSMFIIFGLHEFLASGVFYRVFWILPTLIILIFYIIDFGTKKVNKLIRTILIIILIFGTFMKIADQRTAINKAKNPYQHLKIGNNDIYTFQDPSWFQTINSAISFLKLNVPKEETVLAMPLDVLYNYLSERDTPTRQLVYFEHMGITEAQEIKIINELETKNCNWIVISNRANSPEHGLGFLGKTYCPLMSEYFQEKFEVVISFGNFNVFPGWAGNHACWILKRKNHNISQTP